MKLFDVDWDAVLRELSIWQTFPKDARLLALTTLKLHGYAPRTELGPQLDLIEASGLTIPSPNGVLLLVREDRRPLLKVLRAMHRHPVFDDPSPEQLNHYLEQHFTTTELQAASGAVGNFLPHVNRYTLAPRVGSTHWVDGLLGATSKRARTAWMAARGLDERPLFMHEPDLIVNLQRLVRTLAATPDGVPLKELVMNTRADARPALAKTVHAGLATLVLFAGMRRKDLEPMIGIWPTIAEEMSRPPAAAPSAVVPTDEFAFPVVVEDMTTVLTSAAGAPLRMRVTDLMVFARSRSEIEQRLVAVPPWAGELFGDAQASRVDVAARTLLASELASVRDRMGNPHLEGTAAGARWLALSAHQRMASILTPIRNATDVNPGSYYHESSSAPRFFPFAFPWARPAASLRLRDALTRALLGARDHFVLLEEFLAYHEREANPLLAALSPANPDPYGFGAYHVAEPRDISRNLWRNALSQFLFLRLLPLGGASAGRMGDGRICFRLTEIGRYLLGDTASFEYGSGPAGDVVIQPNFDVVFLGSAPSAEAMIARFAERVGMAPGLVFRITKASVLSAAESGMVVADVIGALAQASSKPVPKNVEREIAGWMATVRRASLREVVLLECADAEAAERVASVLGAKVRRLAPTVFELPEMNAASRAAAVKRLRSAGVFLDLATPAPAPPTRRRARAEAPWDDELP